MSRDECPKAHEMLPTHCTQPHEHTTFPTLGTDLAEVDHRTDPEIGDAPDISGIEPRNSK